MKTLNFIEYLKEQHNIEVVDIKAIAEPEEVTPEETSDDSSETESDLDLDLVIDEKAIAALVKLVGDETAIELAAKDAHDELEAKFKKGDFKGMEKTEDTTPDKLAIASLVVKLVEMGKLDSDKANKFLKKYI